MPTDARSLKTAKSISSLRSRISEYRVNAVVTQGRDCGASKAMPLLASR
jgi:hypothetical protein